MSDISAIPYRTPACDEHLKDNDSDECPWCQLADLRAENKMLCGTLFSLGNKAGIAFVDVCAAIDACKGGGE